MTPEARWTAEELRSELNRYEEMLRAAGKTRNTVNTYVQHPERFINWLDGRYRPAQADRTWEVDLAVSGNGTGLAASDKSWSGRSSRYDPLGRYLAGPFDPGVHISFAEIERLLSGPLTASTRRHRS